MRCEEQEERRGEERRGEGKKRIEELTPSFFNFRVFVFPLHKGLTFLPLSLLPSLSLGLVITADRVSDLGKAERVMSL